MLVFLVLIISWLFLLATHLFHIPHLLFTFCYPWIPGIVALVEAKRRGISLSLSRGEGAGWKMAILFPFLIWAGAFLISIPFGVLAMPPMIQKFFSGGMHPLLVWFIVALIAGVAVFLGAALGLISNFGKELFWRGVLFEKWKEKGWWKGAWMVGFFSGLWFLPFYLYASWNVPQFNFWWAATILPYYLLSAPLLQYIRGCSQSVLPVAFSLGLLETLNVLMVVFFVQPNLAFVGITGLSGLIILGIGNLLLYRERAKKEMVSFSV